MISSYTDIAKEAKANFNGVNDISIPTSNDRIDLPHTSSTIAASNYESNNDVATVSASNNVVEVIQNFPENDDEGFNNINTFPVEIKIILDISSPPRYILRQYITPQSCSLQSERLLTIREKDQYRIASIDLVKGNVTRKNIAVDSAIMSPYSNIIAVRAGEVLQVIDLEFNYNLKKCNFPKSIIHWKWISSNTIAIVTAAHVYHWYIEMSATANTISSVSYTIPSTAGLYDAPPVMMFDIDANLIKVIESQFYATETDNDINISDDYDFLVSYQVSDDFKWSILSIKRFATSAAIHKRHYQSPNYNNSMQLYSMEQRFSQVLTGYIGIFTIAHLPHRITETSNCAQVLCWVVEHQTSNLSNTITSTTTATTATSGNSQLIAKQFRLFIKEVGRGKTSPGGVFSIPSQFIPIYNSSSSSSSNTSDNPTNDTSINAVHSNSEPTTMVYDYINMLEVSKVQGVVYLFSKLGCILGFDVLTGSLLYNVQTINEVVIIATEHRYIGGIIAIMDSGKVIHIGLNQDKLQRYNQALYSSIYDRLVETNTNTFNRLILLGDIQASCRVAAYSPYQFLRTSATIRTIQKLFSPAWQPVAIFQYYSILMTDNGILNSIESIKYAKFCIRNNMIVLLENSFYAGKITITQELATMLIKIPLITNLGFIMNQHLQNSMNSNNMNNIDNTAIHFSITSPIASISTTTTTTNNNNMAALVVNNENNTATVTTSTTTVIDTLVSKHPVADPDYLILYKKLQQLSMHFSSIGSVQKCIQLRDHYRIHLEEALNEKQYSLVAGMGTKLSKLDGILNTFEVLKNDITLKCEEYLHLNNWDELLFFGYLHDQISKLEVQNNSNVADSKQLLSAVDLSNSRDQSSSSGSYNADISMNTRTSSASTSPTPDYNRSTSVLSAVEIPPTSPDIILSPITTTTTTREDSNITTGEDRNLSLKSCSSEPPTLVSLSSQESIIATTTTDIMREGSNSSHNTSTETMRYSD